MSKETFMIESLTRDVIARIMDERHVEMRVAMDLFYGSRTYAALADLETGLYFQSPAYVYDVFVRES